VLSASAVAFLFAFVACVWFALPDQPIKEISPAHWRQAFSSGLIASINTRLGGGMLAGTAAGADESAIAVDWIILGGDRRHNRVTNNTLFGGAFKEEWLNSDREILVI